VAVMTAEALAEPARKLDEAEASIVALSEELEKAKATIRAHEKCAHPDESMRAWSTPHPHRPVMQKLRIGLLGIPGGLSLTLATPADFPI
jgi:hypothetical protein